ncbi:MAG: MarR family transcriptional regulator [Anaerolineales bacterium]|nr:MarR family transcriptional regulator [Anaerolineales bacterium]
MPEENQDHKFSEGMEARMLHLFQRIQQLELSKFPLKDFDITMSQMQLIRYVGENPACHLQDVAEGLGLTSPTVSVSIKRLEELGLITRHPDPDDGRAACLTLTGKSIKAFEHVKRQMFERMQNFLNHLTEEEQNELIKLMEKAVGGIETAANKTSQSTI